MTGSEKRSFEKPDDTRTFEHGRIDVVNFDDGTVGLFTLESGWKWSNDIKPVAGTDSCQKTHVGYTLEGRLHVVMDDGTELDVGPGDAYVIRPGHDAWTEGEQAWRGLEFESDSAKTYAAR